MVQEVTIFKKVYIPLRTESTVPATEPSPTWKVSDLVVQYHRGRQSGMYISTPIPKEEVTFVREKTLSKNSFIKIIFIGLYLLPVL